MAVRDETRRDETRKDAAQADIESLERLLKETLAQPLRAKEPLRPNHAHGTPDLQNLAPQRKNQISLEVPSLQLDIFHAPAAAQTQPQRQANPATQESQNEHKINFEAAMAQLSMIIDPAAGHKNIASAEKREGNENSLHTFFEDELRHEPIKANTFSRDNASETPSPYPLDTMPFAAPPPYAVPDFTQDMDYSEKGLSYPDQNFVPQRMNKVENADVFSAPQAYAASANNAGGYSVSASQKALNEVEARLAEEVAKVATSATTQTKRPYRVLMALGALAAFGTISLISVSLLNGRSKPVDVAKDGIPVIAAKTVPTKEKPENPGGIEIPDQNKQVLSTRTQVESKPAQVLNTTEQPVDLTQIAKKEPVRVVLPNPNQVASQERVGNNAQLEPKRVSSVRLGAAGVESPPVAALPPNAPPTLVSPPASQPQGGVPGLAPRAVYPPPMPTNSARQTPELAASSTPPLAKVESRPDLPAPPATRPVAAAAPPPMVNTAPPSLRTTTNAPLALTPQREASAPSSTAPRVAVTSGTGAFAVQLASRPSEASAKDALSQVRNRFAGQLGGKPLSVVSGEANGQTVYRVRAIGYSQADAQAVCDQIKAGGGGCFVTKQ